MEYKRPIPLDKANNNRIIANVIDDKFILTSFPLYFFIKYDAIEFLNIITRPIMIICRQIKFSRNGAVLAHCLLPDAINKDNKNAKAKLTFIAVLSCINI